MNENRASARRQPLPVDDRGSSSYPDWEAFVRFCEELRFGEIERVKIQDGRPVLAEVVRKKVKFTR